MNPSETKNQFIGENGWVGHNPPWSSRSLPIEVKIFTDGNGIVTVILGEWRLIFKARLVKGVTWVNIK